MLSARQSAIRLLQLMMIASVVLPVLLFAFASWLNWRREIVNFHLVNGGKIVHEFTIGGTDSQELHEDQMALMDMGGMDMGGPTSSDHRQLIDIPSCPHRAALAARSRGSVQPRTTSEHSV